MDYIGTVGRDYFWFPFGSGPSRIEDTTGYVSDVLLVDAFHADFYGIEFRPIKGGYAFTYDRPFYLAPEDSSDESRTIEFTIAKTGEYGGIGWLELRGDVWGSGMSTPVVTSSMMILKASSATDPGAFIPDTAIIFGTGAKDDTIRTPDHVSPPDTFSMVFGNGGDDRIILASDGNYHAYGGKGGDTIIARGAGRDVLHGGGGADILRGGDQDDDLRGEAGDDHLVGRKGNDVLAGGAGEDIVRGGAGNDLLGGEIAFGRFALPVVGLTADDDFLFGGRGRDTLNGGWGDNSLTGGAGKDLFIAWTGGGVDRVEDFEAGVDRLWVECDTCNLRLKTVFRDGNTLVKANGQTEVMLVGVEVTLEEHHGFLM